MVSQVGGGPGGVVLVVAVALVNARGEVLMQRRPLAGAHGGLWEFPGGKVEPGETLEQAAIREMEEELGVVLATDDLVAVNFASDPAQPPAPRAPHVILLYRAHHWQGAMQVSAAEEIGWFAPDALAGLDMPPLDVPLAEALARSLASAGAGVSVDK